MRESVKTKWGLPEKVIYCKRCVESNQRMIGSIQYADTKDSQRETTVFNKEGVCAACLYFDQKKKINWDEREQELQDLCSRFRRKDGSYDVLVPGSGGKDSTFAAHVLKYKYRMNPLTVTWAPHMYTDIGWKNFQAWIHAGFDNILFTPNARVHAKLTRLAFENLLHPFQPFIVGQTYLPPKVAVEKNIQLIFYADSAAERGLGKKFKMDGNRFDTHFYYNVEDSQKRIAGFLPEELAEYGIFQHDLAPYWSLEREVLEKSGIEIHLLPYYINYDPQKMYYYSIEHGGFQPNPDGRSEGTYTKYSSLDDKVDGFHYFTWFIKTGRARATEDAALEIRNGHITREEGVALVRRFDGEFPKKYFKDFLDYTGLTEERFWELIDQGRSPHLWQKKDGKWVLKHQVS